MSELEIKNNYDYYMNHRDELIEKYLEKYLIISNEQIVFVAENLEEAIEYAKTLSVGTYIIQKCEKDTETQTFHTRVRFNE